VTAYRFCRTDDLPLLAQAWGRAYAPHFDPPPPLDTAGLKKWVREVDLWSSSCMVAMDESSQPIGVLLGAKRPAETLIIALGVAPEHLRLGHGRHLLTSLSSKLAILGPPTLVAEIAEDDERSVRCFEACGYGAGPRMRDFELDLRANASCLRAEALAPVTTEELISSEAFAVDAPRPWRRDVGWVRKRDDVQGVALVSPDRIEGWLLWRELDGRREVLGLGGPGPQALLELLVGHFAAQSSLPVTWRQVRDDEMSWDRVEALGFRGGRTYRRYTARAQAA
jgi:ribosomal protein S18 acetylase RimI-like enzyme